MNAAIILDLGATLKAGFAGDEEPRIMFKFSENSSPLDEGIVRDWKILEKVVQEILENLHDGIFDREMAQKRCVLVAVSPFQSREKIQDMLINHFHFGFVHVTLSSVLPLFARGLTSGLVVECGESVTFISFVVEGILQSHLTRKFCVNGRSVSEYLRKLLNNRAYSKSLLDANFIDSIKSKLCYAATDLDYEMRLAKETVCLVQKCFLSDGTAINLSQELFECVEVFFQPSRIGQSTPGLDEFIFGMIQEADVDTRANFYKHIILSGGSSLFPGFAKRLQTDIESRYMTEILKGDTSRKMRFKINVEATDNRRTLVFEGASVLGNLMRNKDEFWIKNTCK